jgi:hypothetical protein
MKERKKERKNERKEIKKERKRKEEKKRKNNYSTIDEIWPNGEAGKIIVKLKKKT